MIPTEICFIEECQEVKGVVRLIGWFANRRGFLIVMERPVNFMDLFDLISTFGWVEERMARGLFVQIVDTVAELYKRHSVIHRDIKDENVVVDLDSGTVWLVDFGAAELLERAKKQRFQGTMSYSPPEVFKRESFLPLEGTVWSLGILLYLLVVGKPPFRNELQICTGKLRFPRTLSSECRALIHRCLCPSPEGRISLEELQQSEWIRDNDAMDTFSSDFEAQWRRRRRKRHGSLNSNSLHAPSDGDEDSDEDCSYRTEVGAVPGPLTIPPMSRGISIANRSPTASSSFVEQNSHSPMEEGANVAVFSDPKDQQDTSPQLLMGTTADILCSSISSSSLAMSEMGFETAPEYDEWNYASFSSSSIALSRDEISDKNAAFHQPNSIEFCSHSERNHSLANSSVPFVQIAFCATQSDGESAVCSFCSFYSSSSSSDREERRRNSFTSDDSFNSSTTFYTANSHENPLLHLTNLCDAIDGDIFQANLTNNIEDEENEEEEDEMTLRTEQPRIILKEWEREMSEDGEEEWDETIREGIGFCAGKGQNKEGEVEEDEQFEEEEQLIDRDEQFGKDEQLLEEDELSDDEQLLLMNVDEPLEEVELLEADELSEQHVQLIDRDKMLGGACSSSAFSLSSREGEKEQFDKNGPKTDGNTRETQKRLDDEFCAGDRGNEQKAKRKGGDRYRRRRGTAQMANGTGRKCNRRRRRVASPPQQLLNLLYH